MPVLVTGATGCVGRALVPRLVEAGGQVRVYVRRDAPEYRRLGVKVAIGEADHLGRLEAALEQVHTLIHLIGGPLPEKGVGVEWLNLGTTEVAVGAAENAEVQRILFLSPLGADPAAAHPYLAAKGRAEEAIRGSSLEHAIFRCSPILGPGSVFSAALERGLSSNARMNPIAVSDVVAALVAADTRDAELRGTWELGGLRTATPSELAVGPRARRAPLFRAMRGLPRELSQLYAVERIAEPGDAVRDFGLTLPSI